MAVIGLAIGVALLALITHVIVVRLWERKPYRQRRRHARKSRERLERGRREAHWFSKAAELDRLAESDM